MQGINDAFNNFSSLSSKKALMYPFSTAGSAATPDQWRMTLAYIEYLWCCSAPTYSSALKSAIGLNLTQITYTDVEGEGDLDLASKNTIERDLMPIIGNKKELFDIGCDLMCYGNAFRSIYLPFTRILICPQCKEHFNLKHVLDTPSVFDFQYRAKALKIGQDGSLPMLGVATCGTADCNYRGAFYVKDLLSDTKKDITIISWRPQDIYIEAGSFDKKKCIYHFMANAEIRKNVEDGRTLTLLTYPIPLMIAVRDRATFRFNDNEIFHLKDTTLSGVLTYGWGIPRMLSHFQLIWQLACLYKINEAIAIDYSVPKRMVTPAPRAGASDAVTADPAGSVDLLPYLMQAKKMWDTNDPGEVTFLPFPVQYQLLGGEAKNLVPDNLLQLAEDTLLSALDVPAELYRNTLAIDGAPLALTIFENKWQWLRNELEKFMDWINEKCQPRLGWAPVKLGLLPLKLDADIQRQTLDVQLAAQETISWSTACEGMGKNYLEEQKRRIDEMKAKMQMEKKLEQEGQLAGMMQEITMSKQPQATGAMPPPPEEGGGEMGMGPPGGAGMGAPGGAAGMPNVMGMMGMIGQGMSPSDYDKMSPIETLEVAQQLAQQVISAGPGRRQMLNELRKQLPESLYAAVKKEVEKMDNQMKEEGRQMIMEQQGGAM